VTAKWGYRVEGHSTVTEAIGQVHARVSATSIARETRKTVEVCYDEGDGWRVDGAAVPGADRYSDRQVREVASEVRVRGDVATADVIEHLYRDRAEMTARLDWVRANADPAFVAAMDEVAW
jgi:hypothetical protein